MEKSIKDTAGFSGVLSIQASLQSNPTRWSVLFKTIPLHDIPPKFYECLSTHKIQTISIGIAGTLDIPPSHHRPFFGLPLPDTISLPIHLHCTFILSGDRRSIRYDEKGSGNLESEFNKWLLTEKVPPLYLQFLADWNHGRPMGECPWWPKGTEPDTLSQAVVTAMQATLPTSTKLVCDTYSGHRIAPSKAHFLQSLCPGGLLKALLPPDLTIFPPGFSHQSSPPLRNVDSNYLTKILRCQAPSIISMYKARKITVGDVVEVAKFLGLSSLPTSLGLPLLPLADGTLASLSAERTTFHCPNRKRKSAQLPFPLDHFLDPKVAEAKDRAIYTSLQVRSLDNMAISRLIMAKIPEQDTFSSSPALEVWLKELWEFLDTTRDTIEDSAFQTLPLIPTYSTRVPTRISFQKLTGSEVLFIEYPTDMPLDACIALGMRIIKAGDCTRKLCAAIRSRRAQPLGIHHSVLRFFVDLPSHQIQNRFRRLSHELHSRFSRWFRHELSGNSRLQPDEKATIQQLPLWETVQVGLAPGGFVPASEALMIPKGVSIDVVRTWATESTAYVPADDLLSLVKESVSLPAFYTDHLSFPLAMNTVTPNYKSLLKGVLCSPEKQQSILVPNANGRMSPSNELYLSSNATFANSFVSQNRAMFLHPDLRALEQQLCSWGLIGTVTAVSFEACALAIHQDARRTDILTRALTVFRTYNTEMPRKLLGDHGSQNVLRNLRFIPRSTGSRYGSVPTDRYHSLPQIVSPSEILDPRFVSVAWTQRATCLEEPSPELLSVNSWTWEPTATEVVRVLFFVPPLTSLPTFRSNTSTSSPLRLHPIYNATPS